MNKDEKEVKSVNEVKELLKVFGFTIKCQQAWNKKLSLSRELEKLKIASADYLSAPIIAKKKNVLSRSVHAYIASLKERQKMVTVVDSGPREIGALRDLLELTLSQFKQFSSIPGVPDQLADTMNHYMWLVMEVHFLMRNRERVSDELLFELEMSEKQMISDLKELKGNVSKPVWRRSKLLIAFMEIYLSCLDTKVGHFKDGRMKDADALFYLMLSEVGGIIWELAGFRARSAKAHERPFNRTIVDELKFSFKHTRVISSALIISFKKPKQIEKVEQQENSKKVA